MSQNGTETPNIGVFDGFGWCSWGVFLLAFMVENGANPKEVWVWLVGGVGWPGGVLTLLHSANFFSSTSYSILHHLHHLKRKNIERV